MTKYFDLNFCILEFRFCILEGQPFLNKLYTVVFVLFVLFLLYTVDSITLIHNYAQYNKVQRRQFKL